MEKSIETFVEAICNKGCRAVRADIAALEQGAWLPELEGLDAASRLAVLRELKSVMAAYGDVCPANPEHET